MAFSNKYAEYYDNIYEKKNYSNEVKKIIIFLEKLNINSNFKYCLDFGCGTGRHSNYLSNFFQIVYGFDISVDMLKIAKKNFLNKKIIFTDSKKIIKGVKFDVIVSFFDVFSYLDFKKLNETVIFFNSVSKKGTIVYLQFWERSSVLLDPPKNYDYKLINKEKNIYRSCNVDLNMKNFFTDIKYSLRYKDKTYQENHRLYLHTEDEINKFFSKFNFFQIKNISEKNTSKYSKELYFIKK